MTCEDLCFVGLKVNVINASSRLYGCMLEHYNTKGTLMVSYIYDGENVQLSDEGCLRVNLSKDCLIPVLDIDILKVLESKKNEKLKIENEIRSIEDFINNLSRPHLQP